jgi:hypothetical protein
MTLRCRDEDSWVCSTIARPGTFLVAASPEACVAAFRAAFGKQAGTTIMRARWEITISPASNGALTAIATYVGRAGLAKGVTMLSATATREEDNAAGLEVTFEAKPNGGGATECSMWLSSRESGFGFTADGRFFRPYMRVVVGHLAALDPSISVQKIIGRSR